MVLQATGSEIYEQSTYLQVCFASLRGLMVGENSALSFSATRLIPKISYLHF